MRRERRRRRHGHTGPLVRLIKSFSFHAADGRRPPLSLPPRANRPPSTLHPFHTPQRLMSPRQHAGTDRELLFASWTTTTTNGR